MRPRSPQFGHVPSGDPGATTAPLRSWDVPSAPSPSLPAANPESFGLYFVLGVCFGLVLTLCLLVLRISCRPRARHPPRPRPDLSEDDDDEDDEDEEEEDTIDRAASESLLPVTEIPLESHGPGDGALPVNVFASAEELERAQRLEERERIIREIWRNGQPDILGTGTGTLGRVHYY